MRNFTRRKFIQNAAVLVSAAVAGPSFSIKAGKPLLSFSTLGCPDWTFRQIIDFAELHNYKGLEIRGLQRELDLSKCKEFNSAQNRADTRRQMDDAGLQFVGLGSSANLHFAEKTQRQKNLEEGRRFIDLAREVNCPFIRVFPNNFPPAEEKNATMDLIASGLLELAGHAKGSNVTVLMETHGDLVKIEDLLTIMQQANDPHTGLVWDIANMWTVTGEPPAEAWNKLKGYIRHVHIKDAKKIGDKLEYTLLGRGEVPILEAIDLLVKGGYKGYYSFEWEKLWHPEIAEPEVALADYARVMRQRRGM